jgi:hypothetical protein
MSARENIVQQIYTLLKEQRSVRLGVVSRDPIIPEELPRTGFPAVNIESSDEERDYLAGDIVEATMDVELVITVNGKERDTQRNTVAHSVEQTILGDTTLRGLMSDIRVSRIENVQNGEAAPYASMRVVYEVKYCYNV